jgi:riboflavin kinase/FMN adenylyltransferase
MNISDEDGRKMVIRGKVEHGNKVGRKLGFPTANICIGDRNDIQVEARNPTGDTPTEASDRPGTADLEEMPNGVYAAKVTVEDDGRRYKAMANLGVKPTFGNDGEKRRLLEVHIIDFTGDLYDREIEVELTTRIRPEKKFENIEALKSQIEKDKSEIEKILCT